jgi:hypothetical protein
MARLPFVVSEEPDDVIVEVVAPLARVRAWAAKAPAVLHRPPTVSGDPDCEPVRNVDGFVMHRIKVVSPIEKTCTQCWETTTDDVCWRCGKGLDPAATPMVPTISYLNPDEYELMTRTW